MKDTELINFTCNKCKEEDTVPYGEIFIGEGGLWCRSCAEEYQEQRYKEFIAKNQGKEQ